VSPQGFEPATYRSRSWHANHSATAPQEWTYDRKMIGRWNRQRNGGRRSSRVSRRYDKIKSMEKDLMLRVHIVREETRETGPRLDWISPESRIRSDMKMLQVWDIRVRWDVRSRVCNPEPFWKFRNFRTFMSISGNSGNVFRIFLYSIKLFQNTIHHFILRWNLLSRLLHKTANSLTWHCYLTSNRAYI